MTAQTNRFVVGDCREYQCHVCKGTGQVLLFGQFWDLCTRCDGDGHVPDRRQPEQRRKNAERRKGI
jgi:DnaJ-class molecular chaperone